MNYESVENLLELSERNWERFLQVAEAGREVSLALKIYSQEVRGDQEELYFRPTDIAGIAYGPDEEIPNNVLDYVDEVLEHGIAEIISQIEKEEEASYSLYRISGEYSHSDHLDSVEAMDEAVQQVQREDDSWDKPGSPRSQIWQV